MATARPRASSTPPRASNSAPSLRRSRLRPGLLLASRPRFALWLARVGDVHRHPGPLDTPRCACVRPGAARGRSKAVGLLFVILGFGAFHPSAPWPLLHTLPVFRSQHVPSRFLYPAVMILGLVAAAGIGQFIMKRSRKWPWLDFVAAGLVFAAGLDIATVARSP